MGFAEVSSVLWRERELLEVLLFKLEEEQLVLASGRTRWLARATHEVEAVLGRIRESELLRQVELASLAAELDLADDVPLERLAEASPEPWAELFRSHRDAFLSLTAEIQGIAQSNRELLSAQVKAVTDALVGAGAPAGESYDARGRAAQRIPAPAPRLVDRRF